MNTSFSKNIVGITTFVSYLIFIFFVMFVPSLTLVSAVANPNAGYELFPCSGTEVSDNGAANAGECNFNDMVTLAQNVAKKIVQIGLIVSPLIFAYAGYLLVTSSDSPGKRDDAKKIAWNVVKGLVVMMLAWLLVDLVLRALLDKTVLDALPWAK